MQATSRIPVPRTLALLLVSLPLLGCEEAGHPSRGRRAAPVKRDLRWQAPARIERSQLTAFAPLPASIPHRDGAATQAQIDLGRRLFFEKRLSANQSISCNSCHPLDRHGVDGRQFSAGHVGQLGGRNAPTVFNAAGHIAQFWDGRAKDVEEQAKGPILNPDEMAMPSEAAVLDVLRGIPEYVEAFEVAFPTDEPRLTYDNLGRAIGAFERQLVTPSRWDAFLRGDSRVLSDAEKRGFNTFVRVGCITCHSGIYVGGRSYQKLGLLRRWPNQKDLGRGAVTGSVTDNLFFKVPSLRNVAKTAPYFHDGSVKDLGEAVRMMARHQLARTLDDERVAAIVAWLECLTGEVPGIAVAGSAGR